MVRAGAWNMPKTLVGSRPASTNIGECNST
ncbi:unannotated protein [freshwater metagenome]|uniref:Unannotated protein n=1 Tax=freshwater metagenome TaxID=449393 RepID=A0A6J7JW56_9ZZZZ